MTSTLAPSGPKLTTSTWILSPGRKRTSPPNSFETMNRLVPTVSRVLDRAIDLSRKRLAHRDRGDGSRVGLSVANASDNDDDDNDDNDDKHNGETIPADQKGSSRGSSRPLLHCNLDHCIHEGSFPEPELRTFAKKS
mmetsp:Transcript_29874/g.70399  ORF Transcript_29874/g.70399 Transcript_29874/m.70399 type:complete len:137 (-) Transcript_29874:230-640(-)